MFLCSKAGGQRSSRICQKLRVSFKVLLHSVSRYSNAVKSTPCAEWKLVWISTFPSPSPGKQEKFKTLGVVLLQRSVALRLSITDTSETSTALADSWVTHDTIHSMCSGCCMQPPYDEARGDVDSLQRVQDTSACSYIKPSFFFTLHLSFNLFIGYIQLNKFRIIRNP